MSLPHRLDTEDNPSIRQLLTASADRVEHWRKSWGKPGTTLIGLHWQGNPKHEKAFTLVGDQSHIKHLPLSGLQEWSLCRYKRHGSSNMTHHY